MVNGPLEEESFFFLSSLCPECAVIGEKKLTLRTCSSSSRFFPKKFETASNIGCAVTDVQSHKSWKTIYDFSSQITNCYTRRRRNQSLFFLNTWQVIPFQIIKSESIFFTQNSAIQLTAEQRSTAQIHNEMSVFRYFISMYLRLAFVLRVDKMASKVQPGMK